MAQDNKYERYLSNWFDINLPDSSEGTLVSDIDFCIVNYKTKKFMLLELKTRGSDIKKWQRDLYNMLHKRLMYSNGTDGREFIGTNLIKFEKTDFNDGEVRLNGNRINEYEFQRFLFDKLGFNETF